MASQVLSIEIDKQTLDQVKYMLDTVKFGVNDALRIAANKTAETAQSRVVKKVASVVTLTQKRVKQDTKLDRANYGNLSSKVTVKSKPIPITEFNTGAQLKSGVNIEVRRGTKIKYKHAFVAQMPNIYSEKPGHVGIFERNKFSEDRQKRGNPTPGGYVGRFGISEMWGPRLSLVFHSNGEEEVMKEMSDFYPKKLLEQAVFLLNRAFNK